MKKQYIISLFMLSISLFSACSTIDTNVQPARVTSNYDAPPKPRHHHSAPTHFTADNR